MRRVAVAVALSLASWLSDGILEAQSPYPGKASLTLTWAKQYEAGDLSGVLVSVEHNLLSGSPAPDARFIWCSIAYSLGRLTTKHVRPDDPRLAKVLGDAPEVYVLQEAEGDYAVGAKFKHPASSDLNDLITIMRLHFGLQSRSRFEESQDLLLHAAAEYPNRFWPAWEATDETLDDRLLGPRLETAVADGSALSKTLFGELVRTSLAKARTDDGNIQMADLWLQRFPDDHDALRCKGIALLNQRHYAEAEAALHRAYMVFPFDLRWYGEAQALLGLYRVRDAEEYIRKIAALRNGGRDSDVEARAHLAEALVAFGSYRAVEAAEAILDGLGASGNDAVLRAHLAFAEHKKDDDNIVYWTRRLATLHPDDASLQRAVIEADVKTDPVRARQELIDLIAREPDSLYSYFAADTVYSVLKDYNAKVQNAKTMADRLPEYNRAFILYAYNLTEIGRYDEALQQLDRYWQLEAKPLNVAMELYGELVALTDGPDALQGKAQAVKAAAPLFDVQRAEKGAKEKPVPHAIYHLSAVAVNASSLTKVKLVDQVGHTDTIEALDVSRDGSMVATGSGDRTILLWDVESGRVLRRLTQPGTASPIYGVAFSADGQFVIGSPRQGPPLVWKTETGEFIRRLGDNSNEERGRIVASVDGKHLLSEEDDGELHLLQADDGREVPLLYETFKFPEPKKQSNGFILNSGARSELAKGGGAFSSDGREIAVIATIGLVVHDLSSDRPRIIIPYDVKNPFSVSFAAGSDRLVLGSEAGVEVFDAQTGKKLNTLQTDSAASIVTASTDGSLILAGTVKGKLVVWETVTGKKVFEGADLEAQISGLRAISDPDQTTTTVAIAAQHRDPVLVSLPDGSHRPLRSRLNGVKYAGFLGDMDTFVTVSDRLRFWNSGQVEKWDLVGASYGLAMCGKESYLGLDHSGLHLVRISDSRSENLFAGERISEPAPGATFACSERYGIAVAGAGGEIIIQQGLKTSPRRIKVQEKGSIEALALSPDGSLIAAAGSSDTLVRVWDVKSGAEVPITRLTQSDFVMGSQITAIVFSRDGQWIVSANTSGYIERIDLKEHKSLSNLSCSRHGVFAVAVSPDSSETVCAGGNDSEIYEYDLSSGSAVAIWKASPFGIDDLNFAADGRTIVSVSGAGSVDFWDTTSQIRTLTLDLFDDDSWAVADEAGRYDAADPQQSVGLQWVSGTRVIELPQLKRRFFTPNLLFRVLKDERLPEIAGMDSILLPPRIRVRSAYDSRTKNLRVQLANDGGGIGDLVVKVNNRLVTLKHTDAQGTNAGGELTINLADAPLVAGDNVVQVAAYDAGGRVESHPVVAHIVGADATARGFHVEKLETTTTDAGRFYAIVVGTSTFGDPALNLAFPAKDAESMATALRVGAEALYGKENVWMRVLTSDARRSEELPTKVNIRAAFDEVRAKGRPEDTLVVYFSGHGAMSHIDHDAYFYLTSDARTLDLDKDPELRNLSTVSSVELFEWLREPVKTMPLKQVVILDTCAAGAASSDLVKLSEKRGIPPDQRRAIELLKDATGTFILMGSAADSVSYEASRYGEGLLTFSLLEGMRGRSLDDGSRLNVSRWFENASDEVPDLARTIGGIQKPVTAAPNGRSFPIALLSVNDRSRIPVSKVRPLLLRVQCADADQDDPLNLLPSIRMQMRALNMARSTGGDAANSPVYMDDADEEMPDALRPKLLYTITGKSVSVRIRLSAGGQVVAERTLTGDLGQISELSTRLADALMKMPLVSTLTVLRP